MIQKNGNPPVAASINFTSTPPLIELPVINMPQAKNRADNSKIAPPLIYPMNYDRKNSYKDVDKVSSSKAQRDVWMNAVQPDVKTKVVAKVAEAKAANAFDATLGAYYLKHNHDKSLKLIGTVDTIIENSLIPTWTRAGLASAYDVDHVKELQLGGQNYQTNMELLNFSINRASGGAVKDEIDHKIKDYISAETATKSKDSQDPKFPKTESEAKKNFNISFKTVTFTNNPKASGNSHYWSFEEINGGKQVESFAAMSTDEIKKARGDKDNPLVYTSPAGGVGLSWNDIQVFNGPTIKFSKPSFITDQTGKKLGEKIGSMGVEFTVYGSDKKTKNFSIPIAQMDGVLFGGSIPRKGQSGGGGLEQILVGIDLPGMSPINIGHAEIVQGKGMVVKGTISPSLDVIKGAEIDFSVDGNDIEISKTFSAGEFNVPSPFKINDASLTVFGGTKGFGLKGDVLFEIKDIGNGKITGSTKTDGSFGIKGSFDFDKKLFSGGAKIDVSYDNKDLWAIKGEIGIAKDTVKGIKSGKVTVSYAKDNLEASGTAEVTLKGVKEVTLKIKFAEEGSEIEGGVKIEKLPGIKEGEGTLKVAKAAGGGAYDFSGKGKISPDIKGLDSQLDFEFQNDIFSVDATIKDFKYGRLSGTLKVGITNQVIADGKPTGKAGKDYSVYGKSDLELKIVEGVVATAGIELKPYGDMIVKGGVKLPAKFQVVPKLFSIENKPIIPFPTISIPLFGIPLGGTTIGLGATITPKLLANVQLGPGNLTNTKAEVTFDPKNPDDMSITGGADFEFTAEAGITAGVDFGIAVSAGPASVTGGINLSAFIKALAKQPVFHADLKYSPKAGFELDGKVQAILKAILGFSGTLFLEAKVDVFIASASKRVEYELIKKEIDTGLDIGFEFPFKYKDGKSDISFDSLKFTYPKFDEAFMNNIKHQMIDPVKDKIF